MQPIRKINNEEKAILNYLVKHSSLQLPKGWDQNLFVRKMDDGEMGSFVVIQDGYDVNVKRRFGQQVSEFQFLDEDGVTVLVSLNLDEENKLFEVDV